MLGCFFFFFFRDTGIENTSCTTTGLTQTAESGGKEHKATTSDVEGVPPSAPTAARHSNRERANALEAAHASSEHPVVPSLPSSDGQDPRLRPCLGPGQLTHERESLLGPWAAHLRGQDDQTSSPPSSGELRVSDHLLLTCCLCDGHACLNITVAAGTTVSSNGRHQRGAIHLPLSRAAERLCTALGGPSLEGGH